MTFGIFEKIAGGIAVVALLLAGWFYVAANRLEARVEVLTDDNVKLTAAVAAQEKSISTLQNEAAELGKELVLRNDTIDKLNKAAFDAASEIGTAQNEGTPSGCDIDAPLPDSLLNPLRVLTGQAVGNR